MKIFKPQWWEAFFTQDLSLRRKLFVSCGLSIVGFSFTYFLFSYLGSYFTSLTIVTVILIALYAGVLVAVPLAILQSTAADFFFIPPLGSVLDSVGGYEHLFIIVSLALFVAFLGSSLRAMTRKAILARQQAERATAVMENILALVSHDIRNPLTGIKLGSQLILRSPDQPDQHAPILSNILRSLNQIDEMIQSLLDVSRMRANKDIPLKLQRCDLLIEVSNAVKNLSLESNRLKFIGSESIEGEWSISGIRRALQNLVTNALKYGASDRPITIHLQKIGSQAVLSVHNEGNEIPIAEQAKLFHAFERAAGTQKTNIEGWGIGLSVVKGIAEAHGGSVRVESSRELGTIFTLNLPIKQNAETKI